MASLRLFVLIAALAGCEGVPGTQPVTQIAVASQSVVIAGPRGFCVDRRSTTDEATGAFVLLGSCTAIAGTSPTQPPAAPALLMASVSAASGGVSVAQSFADLDSFFGSESGRAALSRSGDPATVRLLYAQGRGDVFYIRARDTSPGPLPTATAEYWRAIFNVNGRIVSASVMGLKDRPMSSDTARLTLDSFVAQTKAANAARKPAVTSRNLNVLVLR